MATTVINGKEVDVTTIMDKSVEYTPTSEEISRVKAGYIKHLDEFFPGSLYYKTGIDKMFRSGGEFWKAKGWLISLMKKSPYYNGNLQIVIPDSPYSRGINIDACERFFSFCNEFLNKETYFGDSKGNHLTKEEVIARCDSLNIQENTCCQIFHRAIKAGNGTRAEMAKRVVERVRAERAAISERKYTWQAEMEMLDAISYYIRSRGADAQLVDEWLESRVKDILKDDGRFCRQGQKLSKLVSKIGKKTGLNKIVDLRDVSFTNQDGERVARVKDMGWNYMFAMFGDAINPMVNTAIAVMSVNPVDYLRMSFGYKWASCMTTDKENRRRADNNYHGMYCGGVESYMLDNSTFLLYYLPTKKDLEEGKYWGKTNEWYENGTIDPARELGPEWLDKLKRCNFHVGEDKIVQGRVYPDGRDGGDQSLSTDMRVLVQTIIAGLYDETNLWTVKKGTEWSGRYVYSDGAHYRDYNTYEDCTLSYWKRIDGYQNNEHFDVGTDSICPECGEYHCWDENIFCERCVDDVVCCDSCGERLSEDDVIYVDGVPYCHDCAVICDECGEGEMRDDVTYINRYDRCVCSYCRREYYTWSDYEDEYIHNDDLIETEEGGLYGNWSRGDAYENCYECGSDHDLEDLHYDEETDHYYCDECYEELLAERREEELDLYEDDPNSDEHIA